MAEIAIGRANQTKSNQIKPAGRQKVSCAQCALADKSSFYKMTANFSFPTNIRFGAGCLQELPGHLAALGVNRPLIVTDPGLLPTDAFKSLEKISGKQWAVFSGVHPNPTIEDVEAATAAYREQASAIR
jgi:hypothetical protein